MINVKNISVYQKALISTCHIFFDSEISFVNLQHTHTNSKASFVLESLSLKISNTYTKKNRLRLCGDFNLYLFGAKYFPRTT